MCASVCLYVLKSKSDLALKKCSVLYLYTLVLLSVSEMEGMAQGGILYGEDVPYSYAR